MISYPTPQNSFVQNGVNASQMELWRVCMCFCRFYIIVLFIVTRNKEVCGDSTMVPSWIDWAESQNGSGWRRPTTIRIRDLSVPHKLHLFAKSQNGLRKLVVVDLRSLKIIAPQFPLCPTGNSWNAFFVCGSSGRAALIACSTHICPT